MIEVSSPITPERAKQELDAFQDTYHGGYFEGNPLDPMGRSAYGVLGYMSVIHATYLRCIRPYVKPETVALEIGPGRGAWTRTLLPAREVWCLDALSAEHNQFWNLIGNKSHVKYFQVDDFSCSMLPDNYFTYFFSFGVFCHISFAGLTAYLTNIRPKLRSGSDGFVMIADYEKYNRAIREISKHTAWRVCELIKPYKPLKVALWRKAVAYFEKTSIERQRDLRERLPDTDDTPRTERWYHAGTDRTCELLVSLGYEVVDPDVGVLHRDPVIHFRKP